VVLGQCRATVHAIWIIRRGVGRGPPPPDRVAVPPADLELESRLRGGPRGDGLVLGEQQLGPTRDRPRGRDRSRPIVGLPPALTVHSNGTDGLCSLGVDRIVRCWGDPFADGLGRDEPTFSGAFPTPQPITRVGRVRDIQPTGPGWAALDDAGRLHLWGRGINGTGWRVGSPQLFGPGASFSRLATWLDGVACALDSLGRATCVNAHRAISHVAFSNLDPLAFRAFWGLPPL
jgi:hypothetical protein